MRKFLSVLTPVVVSVSLVTAACASGDEPATTTTSPPATTPPATTTTVPESTTMVSIVEPGCSATDPDLVVGTAGGAGLPAAVAATRQEIVNSALTCDFDRLGMLAGGKSGEFTYSFGGGDDPAEYWRQLELSGEEPIEILAALLGMSYRTMESEAADGDTLTIYSWPAAFGGDATDEQWDEARALYGDAEIAAMKEFGGYIGYRVGITDAGDWVFFVAGD